jgi:putative phosphoribosyl transferase
MDLLTTDEEAEDMRTARLRFGVPLLAGRVIGAIDSLTGDPALADVPVGCFGASTALLGGEARIEIMPDR